MRAADRARTRTPRLTSTGDRSRAMAGQGPAGASCAPRTTACERAWISCALPLPRRACRRACSACASWCLVLGDDLQERPLRDEKLTVFMRSPAHGGTPSSDGPVAESRSGGIRSVMPRTRPRRLRSIRRLETMVGWVLRPTDVSHHLDHARAAQEMARIAAARAEAAAREWRTGKEKRWTKRSSTCRCGGSSRSWA